MTLNELEIAVSTLHVEPGDRIVLTTPEKLTLETATLIREQLEHLFPGHQCIVVGAGQQLTVVH